MVASIKHLKALLPAVALAVAIAVVPMSSATAQDVQALLDRIERLERDIRTLNVQVARDGGSASTTIAAESAAGSAALPAPSPSGIAHLDARITTLENDLRATTGSVEELGHLINQLAERIDKLVGDVDFRLSELEQGRATPRPALEQGTGLIAQDGTQAPQSVTTQSSQGSGVLGTISADQLSSIGQDDTGQTVSVETAPATTGTLSAEDLAAPAPADASVGAVAEPEVAALAPQDAYAQAFALLRQARYDDAAVALQAFVDEHSEHELSSNARYWLGETFYVRSEYVRAAEVFFEAYRLAPQGPKAPDTLLKLGMALGNLGKTAEACAAFAKLQQEFANPSPAITSKLERESVRNNCGG